MILNVIKEGGYTSNNTDKQKEIDKDSNLNNVQLKKIKGNTISNLQMEEKSKFH